VWAEEKKLCRLVQWLRPKELRIKDLEKARARGDLREEEEKYGLPGETTTVRNRSKIKGGGGARRGGTLGEDLRKKNRIQ